MSRSEGYDGEKALMEGNGLSKSLDMGACLGKSQEGRIRGNRIAANNTGEKEAKFGSEDLENVQNLELGRGVSDVT